MAETKVCENCEQEIGASEKVCPKCGTDFEALEQEIGVIERAQKVLTKRNKVKETPTPETKPAAKKSIFASLTRKGQ